MDVAVGIVGQRGNERAQGLAASLAETLERSGRDGGETAVVVDEATGEAVDAPACPVDEMDDRDLVVSIGGDGTLLFVAREVGPTPILGVNLGEVGFLNAVAPEDAVDVVTDLVADYRETGAFEGRELARLEATSDGADWTLEPALNEIVVHGPRRGPGGGATVEVRVDGGQYAASHADGVLVATPAGSTAYNLSEGGPLVHPTADALVVTQMAAADSMPPLVVDPDTDLSITISDSDTGYAISDGRNRRRLDPPATITVSVADEPIRLVGPRGDFVSSLEKLD
ncbi:NAD(+)/NADH kinase [Haloterrigena sp. SYSU A558-1]|uniref:NAD kinase n=1 Tax=Haloterrigena gelatinilytica TaxID=2741724 RepID=A0A8J8KEH8_9EURY|nr:NAD(+)/NADH kinase [Haloterrigena gelatinilytica]NUB90611.1 NAD(+)/NADH kinase [Haloterrigena gelatinilytica]NUC73570.1 NAD(+)/NADH kinase [Haloterrigena gelatinilytica]